jgi:Asp/Glu/hydantoin racemase
MTVVHQQARVLIFNPNTSKSITDTFIPVLSSLHLPNTEITYTYWTCPTGPTIIKTRADMYESASHCIPLLLEIAHEYDGFLGACYADHPAVRLLQSYVENKPVVGIFDASVHAAVQLVGQGGKFGIVTTGLPFETLLAEGVRQSLGSMGEERTRQLCRFGGVAASGIGIGDLGHEARGRAREKIIAATTRLVCSGEIDVVCVGGVILSGMESWIREACEKELGVDRGREVKIIDQLAVGAVVLDAILRGESFVNYSPALR